MAENENGEEKTEEATDKKRRDARKKGQVLKSQDVAIVCSLFLTFLVLRVTAKLSYTRLYELMQKYLSSAGLGIGDIVKVDKESFLSNLLKDCTVTFLLACGILLAVSFVVAIISTGIQTKFLISFETLKFKFDKLNPINGIKKMFSIKSLFELGKSLLKMIILVVVVYNQISKRLNEIVRLIQIEPGASLVYIAETVFSIVMTIGMVFVAVAVVDYLFQWRTFENDLKMTKQEVKDEYKQMEGDPNVKSKRRSIQRQMAQQRMMEEVPGADVVIRNPTHFAVAVKYDPQKASAPVVVAKGTDKVAMRIVETAEAADVPAVENKPLARSLYDKTEIGQEIAPEFYQAVADVLWFVYNLKHKPVPTAKKSTANPDAPFSY